MFVLRNALYLQNQPFLQRRTGPFVNAVALSDLLLSFLGFSFEVRLLPRRLQNSPYFYVFKYARAVQQKVWNEAENTEQDWGETLKYGLSVFRSNLIPASPSHGQFPLAKFR